MRAARDHRLDSPTRRSQADDYREGNAQLMLGDEMPGIHGVRSSSNMRRGSNEKHMSSSDRRLSRSGGIPSSSESRPISSDKRELSSGDSRLQSSDRRSNSGDRSSYTGDKRRSVDRTTYNGDSSPRSDIRSHTGDNRQYSGGRAGSLYDNNRSSPADRRSFPDDHKPPHYEDLRPASGDHRPYSGNSESSVGAHMPYYDDHRPHDDNRRPYSGERRPPPSESRRQFSSRSPSGGVSQHRRSDPSQLLAPITQEIPDRNNSAPINYGQSGPATTDLRQNSAIHRPPSSATSSTSFLDKYAIHNAMESRQFSDHGSIRSASSIRPAVQNRSSSLVADRGSDSSPMSLVEQILDRGRATVDQAQLGIKKYTAPSATQLTRQEASVSSIAGSSESQSMVANPKLTRPTDKSDERRENRHSKGSKDQLGTIQQEVLDRGRAVIESRQSIHKNKSSSANHRQLVPDGQIIKPTPILPVTTQCTDVRQLIPDQTRFDVIHGQPLSEGILSSSQQSLSSLDSATKLLVQQAVPVQTNSSTAHRKPVFSRGPSPITAGQLIPNTGPETIVNTQQPVDSRSPSPILKHRQLEQPTSIRKDAATKMSSTEPTAVASRMGPDHKTKSAPAFTDQRKTDTNKMMTVHGQAAQGHQKPTTDKIKLSDDKTDSKAPHRLSRLDRTDNRSKINQTISNPESSAVKTAGDQITPGNQVMTGSEQALIEKIHGRHSERTSKQPTVDSTQRVSSSGQPGERVIRISTQSSKQVAFEKIPGTAKKIISKAAQRPSNETKDVNTVQTSPRTNKENKSANAQVLESSKKMVSREKLHPQAPSNHTSSHDQRIGGVVQPITPDNKIPTQTAKSLSQVKPGVNASIPPPVQGMPVIIQTDGKKSRFKNQIHYIEKSQQLAHQKAVKSVEKMAQQQSDKPAVEKVREHKGPRENVILLQKSQPAELSRQEKHNSSKVIKIQADNVGYTTRAAEDNQSNITSQSSTQLSNQSTPNESSSEILSDSSTSNNSRPNLSQQQIPVTNVVNDLPLKTKRSSASIDRLSLLSENLTTGSTNPSSYDQLSIFSATTSRAASYTSIPTSKITTRTSSSQASISASPSDQSQSFTPIPEPIKVRTPQAVHTKLPQTKRVTISPRQLEVGRDKSAADFRTKKVSADISQIDHRKTRAASPADYGVSQPTSGKTRDSRKSMEKDSISTSIPTKSQNQVASASINLSNSQNKSTIKARNIVNSEAKLISGNPGKPSAVRLIPRSSGEPTGQGKHLKSSAGLPMISTGNISQSNSVSKIDTVKQPSKVSSQPVKTQGNVPTAPTQSISQTSAVSSPGTPGKPLTPQAKPANAPPIKPPAPGAKPVTQPLAQPAAQPAVKPAAQPVAKNSTLTPSLVTTKIQNKPTTLINPAAPQKGLPVPTAQPPKVLTVPSKNIAVQPAVKNSTLPSSATSSKPQSKSPTTTATTQQVATSRPSQATTTPASTTAVKEKGPPQAGTKPSTAQTAPAKVGTAPPAAQSGPTKAVTIQSLPSKASNPASILSSTPSKTGTVQSVPSKTGSVQSVPSKTGTVQSAPSKTGTVQSVPSKTGTVQSAPSKTGTVQSVPSKTGTVQSAPSKTQSQSVPAKLSQSVNAQPKVQIAQPVTSATSQVIAKPSTSLTTVHGTPSTIVTMPTVTQKPSIPSTTISALQPNLTTVSVIKSTPSGKLSTASTSTPTGKIKPTNKTIWSRGAKSQSSTGGMTPAVAQNSITGARRAPFQRGRGGPMFGRGSATTGRISSRTSTVTSGPPARSSVPAGARGAISATTSSSSSSARTPPTSTVVSTIEREKKVMTSLPSTTMSELLIYSARDPSASSKTSKSSVTTVASETDKSTTTVSTEEKKPIIGEKKSINDKIKAFFVRNFKEPRWRRKQNKIVYEQCKQLVPNCKQPVILKGKKRYLRYDQSLTDCCHTCEVGWCTCLVPCYVSGKIAEKIGGSCMLHCFISCIPLLNCCCRAITRMKVRHMRKIGGSIMYDIPVAYMCYCCSLCQDAHEVEAFVFRNETIERE